MRDEISKLRRRGVDASNGRRQKRQERREISEHTCTWTGLPKPRKGAEMM